MSPNIQQIVDHVVALNNSGAYYSSAGNSSAAFRAFRAALQATKRLKPFCDMKNKENFSNTCVMLDQAMEPMHSNLSPMKQGPWSQTRSAVYNHPIQLPTYMTLTEDHVNQTFLSLSAVTVFNLALCHHQAAMEIGVSSPDGSSRAIYLRKAAKLYESAFTLVSKAYGLVYGKCTFFLSATLNNMSIAFEELDETELAKKGFQQLLAMLVHLEEMNRAMNITSDHGKRTEVFFRTAMMHVVFPNCSFPAPAA